jgi:hypothetical protein
MKSIGYAAEIKKKKEMLQLQLLKYSHVESVLC